MLPPPCSTWRISWSCVRRVATSSSAGPRRPPASPSAWQLRHCLRLEHQRALPLQRACGPRGRFAGTGQRAPGVHHGRPRRRLARVRQRRPAEDREDDDEHRDRPAPPALLAHARQERQQRSRNEDAERPARRAGRRLHPGRQQRGDREDPEEEEVRPRHGLDDRRDPARRPGRRARRPRRRRRRQHEQTRRTRGPSGTPSGTNGTPSFVDQPRRTPRRRSRLSHQPPRHRPLVDAELEHHQQVQADEPDQQARDHEDVQREEARQRLAGDDRPAEHRPGRAGRR